MASTYSPILKLELIGNGDQSGTWGTTTNTNLGTLIEQAIAGTASIDVTSGNVTLTDLNGISDQARCAAILVSGTPGVSRNIIAPALSKLYVISNGSNAAVVIKTSSSTGYTIPTGNTVLVYFNGTDFILAGQASATTNTANTLVLRDASGNFSAGTITASLTGNATNITGTLAITQGGTGATATTGSGSNVLSTSPTLVTPVLGTPTSGNLLNCTFPTLNQNTTGTAANVTGVVAVANGGSGTATPALVAGTNVSITGSWPNQTINASGGVSSISFGSTGLTPSTTTTGAVTVAGTLAVASGGTGVTTSTGSGSNVLSTSPTLVTPVLGTPTSGNLVNCTFPTLNQNTTGTAAGLSATLAIGSGGTNSTATPTAGGAVYGTGTAMAITAAGTTGQVLTSQGSSAPIWAAAGGGIGGMQTFTASGTFTIPTGVTKVKVTVTAGGGGGGYYTGCSAATGGGAGGTAIKVLTGLTAGNTIIVTVGAPGTAAYSDASITGGTGGTSSISSGTQTITTVSATGGVGGYSSSSSTFPNSGYGGAASNGSININGGGAPISGSTVSAGGGSFWGGGSSFTTSGSATPNLAYGSGAGATYALSNPGGSGIVVFEW